MLTDKIKDMVRSILPSTKRKGAKDDKAHSVRRNRRQIKQICHDAVLEYYEEKHEEDLGLLSLEDKNSVDYKFVESDFEKKETTKDAVRDRRRGDKINHFVRWATAITKHFKEDDLENKYYAVASKIGGLKDVIRKHALEHFIPPWRINALSYSPNYRKEPELISKELFAKLLQEAFELDHKGLNKILKKVTLNCYDNSLPCHKKVNVNREYFLYDKIYERDEKGNPLKKFKFTSTKEHNTPDYIFLSKYSVTTTENVHDSTSCPNYAWIKGPQDMPKLIERLTSYSITKSGLTHEYGDYNLLEILRFLKAKNLLDIELPPLKKKWIF